MTKLFDRKILLFLLFIVLTLSNPLHSQENLRYFDTTELQTDEIRLTILYPSLGSLASLAKLQERNIFAPKDLVVIGVFHEKERTNYQSSIAWVKKNKLDWIKFHKLSAELNKDNLFQKNALSAEFTKIFKRSDGIIFFGGADIPPYTYKEKTNLLTSIATPYRHFLELSFVFHLLGGLQNINAPALLDSAPEFPILGICLGEQTLNVGTGGTMIQDIWSEVYDKNFLDDIISMSKENWHNNPLPRLYPEAGLVRYNMHRIQLKENSTIIKEFGFSKSETPYILSSHHQAVEKLGKGMHAIATSMDGKVIEAIEHDKFPHVLGIQFHPEFPMLWDPKTKVQITPEDREKISLFSILEKNPPSLTFHKKIWSWFAEKLTEFHNN